MTIAAEPMEEIARVVKLHRCESVLLGLSKITEASDGASLEWLLSTVGADVVVYRSGSRGKLADATKILVPVAGRGGHQYLLARLLGSLTRSSKREVTFLRIVPEQTSKEEIRKAKRELIQVAQDNMSGRCQWEVVESNEVVEVIAKFANQSDLLVLGAQQVAPKKRTFGTLTRQIAARTDCGVLVMSGQR